MQIQSAYMKIPCPKYVQSICQMLGVAETTIHIFLAQIILYLF